jgi:hypothetical protein
LLLAGCRGAYDRVNQTVAFDGSVEADGLPTPPSTLLAIRAGYRPVLHPDIEETPHF